MNLNNKASVVIHTYYRYNYLQTILELLLKQTIKPKEVIISDQTPIKDRPQGFYESFKDLPLKVINLDRPMHAPAQNIGARNSTGEILIFIDDDCEFREDFLEQHLRVMYEENVDVVVGPNSPTWELPEYFTRDYRHSDPVSFFLKTIPAKWHGMVLYTIGGNTSIKREAFFDVNGYDEKMPRMADIELGFRLFKNGAKIYHSTKPFIHHLKGTSGGSRKAQQNLQYKRLLSWLYLYKKHFPGWGTQQFILHEIMCAILFREPISGFFKKGNLKNPFLPLVRIAQLIKACVESNKLLNK